MDDSKVITFTNGEKFPHVITASPIRDPDQWIMGWDDQSGTGWSDNDYNDMVFRLEIGDVHCRLSDAVRLLQILTGQDTDIPSCIPDIAADGYMGLAEAVYLLQQTAELR